MRFLATVLLLAGAAMYAQDAPPAPPKKAGGMPHKNLKILPDEDLMNVMRTYVTSLGLGRNCQFCHAQGDFAADTNPKKDIARKMIKMVNDNNAMFADGKVHVTCYTCHRGKNMPESTPPAAAAPAAQ
jgi:photosynthetic reaction center cytochrome c subunit